MWGYSNNVSAEVEQLPKWNSWVDPMAGHRSPGSEGTARFRWADHLLLGLIDRVGSGARGSTMATSFASFSVVPSATRTGRRWDVGRKPKLLAKPTADALSETAQK